MNLGSSSNLVQARRASLRTCASSLWKPIYTKSQHEAILSGSTPKGDHAPTRFAHMVCASPKKLNATFASVAAKRAWDSTAAVLKDSVFDILRGPLRWNRRI